jgi:murein DD-endopeptidase MepM/ murein hydrolase activator NlpD
MLDDLSKEGKEIDLLQEKVTTVKFSFPFLKPIKGYVTSDYGVKRIYDNGKAGWPHKGIDIGAPEGTTVVADADGVVIAALNTQGHGNFIMIDHGGGVYTLYMHLKNIIAKKGDFVKRGDVVATVGNTGLSTGPHLHWQINVFSVPVNPREFLAGF